MSQQQKTRLSRYKQSGVNIDAGDKLVEKIKPLVKMTARKGSDCDIGGFGGLFDIASLGYKQPVLVSGTDGVGTKLKIAQAANIHNTIGIDLVAMCVNDIVVQGAEPLFFLDYFATGKLNISVAQKVIKGIAIGCKEAGCALIGGETAEMPGVYNGEDYDLAGFSVGVVERKKILPHKDVKEGDIIIGLPSSGFHSNGFSLVRHVIKEKGLSYQYKPAGFRYNLGKMLLTPTRIYVKLCLYLINKSEIKAFAHITGGGLTDNIPRVLPDGFSAEIDCNKWNISYIFKWLMKEGNIEPEEMLRTFNSGIGMVAIVSPSSLTSVKKALKEKSEKYSVIGKIVKKKGEPKVIYRNINGFGK